MNLYTLIVSVLLLSGCSTFTVSKSTFPEAPPSLLDPCPPLTKVEDTDKASTLLSTVTGNYMKYHECSTRVEQWNYWYKEQRKLVH